MDTTSLIIVVCVVIPAILAISICVIIFCSSHNKSRKFYHQNSSFEDRRSCERLPHDSHFIDCSRNYRYQSQHRLPEPPPIFEQFSPSYDVAVSQVGRQPLSMFSATRTMPSIVNVQQSSPYMSSSSMYSAMPPSYAEIFLTPHTLTNQ